MSVLEETIGDLIKSVSGLARQAVAAYAPVVSSIVRDQSQDIRHIEHTLDGLLDFCVDPEALLLYKKLCRHYYDIDPAATADYVNTGSSGGSARGLANLENLIIRPICILSRGSPGSSA